MLRESRRSHSAWRLQLGKRLTDLFYYDRQSRPRHATGGQPSVQPSEGAPDGGQNTGQFGYENTTEEVRILFGALKTAASRTTTMNRARNVLSISSADC